MFIATERVLYRSSDSSVLIHNGGPNEHSSGKNGYAFLYLAIIYRRKTLCCYFC